MKKFDIPILNQEQWDTLQRNLSFISNLSSKLYNCNEVDKNSILDMISICLGEIDVILDRVYTQEKVGEYLKKENK